MSVRCVEFSVVFLLCGLTLPFAANAQFTNVAAATNTDIGGIKDGGVGWADLNNDGCLDLIVNTQVNGAGGFTRILFSDCNLPDPTFSDVTNTHAAGCENAVRERSISIADINNDGLLDFCRNTFTAIEIYLNKGPTATPAYSFGDATQAANLTITGIPNGQNCEGVGWIDYDNDGWLDLAIENHNSGIDLYRNPADGTANFTHVTPNTSPLGLSTGGGGTEGDYGTIGDYNDDGFVDLFFRRTNDYDLWTNLGTGNFTDNTSFDIQTANGNKGGTLMCDFDNDGDLDLFWTDEGVNQIYEQTGVNSGNFVATNEPATSSGITIDNSIDGCACGDVDNDGDLDLFLAGNGAANSYLFINEGGFSFNHNNMGIAPGANTEGCAFADYDQDGDLDLYIQVRGSGNELWRNGLVSNDYLIIQPKREVAPGVYRPDHGASVEIFDCNGNSLSGIRPLLSLKGHGSCPAPELHFGLENSITEPLVVHVSFIEVNGTRAEIDTLIYPSMLGTRRIEIRSNSTSTVGGCTALPVELIDFSVVCSAQGTALQWTTASEQNNSHFLIERSADLTHWQTVGILTGAGNSSQPLNYSFYDDDAPEQLTYYRLQQVDYDGSHEFSRVVACDQQAESGLRLYPNPAHDFVIIEGAMKTPLSVYNVWGEDVTTLIGVSTGESSIELNITRLPVGSYFVQSGQQQFQFQVIH